MDLDLPIDLPIGRNSEFPQSSVNEEGVIRTLDPCPRETPPQGLGILKEYDSVLGTNRIEKLLFVRKFYLRLLNRESVYFSGYFMVNMYIKLVMFQWVSFKDPPRTGHALSRSQ